ncbi:hypothetical protein CYMTET_53540 [Cymbomonas tetramitiformis]|uniref:Uncharacterized protein n=1 Tax=Cymbomonas tetramitiformis TaxID=36881 RepID=A0AAE0BHX4_9CHLO|nr:hypothetical protein CYMTET_53540 [Cymbomonas tetramitiformis]
MRGRTLFTDAPSTTPLTTTTPSTSSAPNTFCWSQGPTSDVNTSSSTLEYQHNSFLDVLNAEFILTGSVTPTSIEWPHSLLPVQFTRNPGDGATKGLSLGSGASNTYMTLRMGNSTHYVVHNFHYQTTIPTGQLLRFQLTCGFQQGSAGERWCELKAEVSGAQIYISGSQAIAISGDIYNQDGGRFGDIWGWHFVGNLGYLSVCEGEDFFLWITL